MIYSYLNVSNSASVFLFPVPPDFDFQQGCWLGRLSDYSQPTELKHCVGQSTRSIWTKSETLKEEERNPPSHQVPTHTSQEGLQWWAGRSAKGIFSGQFRKTRLLIIQFHRYILKNRALISISYMTEEVLTTHLASYSLFSLEHAVA